MRLLIIIVNVMNINKIIIINIIFSVISTNKGRLLTREVNAVYTCNSILYESMKLT